MSDCTSCTRRSLINDSYWDIFIFTLHMRDSIVIVIICLFIYLISREQKFHVFVDSSFVCLFVWVLIDCVEFGLFLL